MRRRRHTVSSHTVTAGFTTAFPAWFSVTGTGITPYRVVAGSADPYLTGTSYSEADTVWVNLIPGEAGIKAWVVDARGVLVIPAYISWSGTGRVGEAPRPPLWQWSVLGWRPGTQAGDVGTLTISRDGAIPATITGAMFGGYFSAWKLSPPSLTLHVGEQAQLAWTAVDRDGVRTMAWNPATGKPTRDFRSSDGTVATVSSAGVVTAASPGTAVIDIAPEYGSGCTVTVVP